MADHHFVFSFFVCVYALNENTSIALAANNLKHKTLGGMYAGSLTVKVLRGRQGYPSEILGIKRHLDNDNVFSGHQSGSAMGYSNLTMITKIRLMRIKTERWVEEISSAAVRAMSAKPAFRMIAKRTTLSGLPGS